MFDDDSVWPFPPEMVIFDPTTRDEVDRAEALALDLPFDLHNIIDLNPYIYGNLGNGPRIGKFCKFLGGTVATLDGKTIPSTVGIGVIVGDAHGRVVIGFETEAVSLTYLGWVNPEDVEMVDIHHEVHTWLH